MAVEGTTQGRAQRAAIFVLALKYFFVFVFSTGRSWLTSSAAFLDLSEHVRSVEIPGLLPRDVIAHKGIG